MGVGCLAALVLSWVSDSVGCLAVLVFLSLHAVLVDSWVLVVQLCWYCLGCLTVLVFLSLHAVLLFSWVLVVQLCWYCLGCLLVLVFLSLHAVLQDSLVLVVQLCWYCLGCLIVLCWVSGGIGVVLGVMVVLSWVSWWCCLCCHGVLGVVFGLQLNSFLQLLLQLSVDQDLIQQVFCQLYYFMGACSLNNLLLRKDICNWSKGMQVR